MSLYKKLAHRHVVGFIHAEYDVKSSAFFIFLEYVPGAEELGAGRIRGPGVAGHAWPPHQRPDPHFGPNPFIRTFMLHQIALNFCMYIIHVVLTLLSGGSIASMLSRFGRFSEDLVRNYTRQLLLGLEYLHGCKIVHRDLKVGCSVAGFAAR